MTRFNWEKLYFFKLKQNGNKRLAIEKRRELGQFRHNLSVGQHPVFDAFVWRMHDDVDLNDLADRSRQSQALARCDRQLRGPLAENDQPRVNAARIDRYPSAPVQCDKPYFAYHVPCHPWRRNVHCILQECSGSDCTLYFYPRDAMLARVFARAPCLSVRLSVCLSHAGIVSKRRKMIHVMISSLPGSPTILVFWSQISSDILRRRSPERGLKQGWGGKIQPFSSFKHQYLENGCR